MNGIDLSSRLQIWPVVRHEQKGDLYLLFHQGKAAWTVVNRLGFEIAVLCDGERTLAQVCSILAERYEVGLQTIEADLAIFIIQLEKTGFLSGREDPFVFEFPPLSSLFLHITNNCNLRCHHCYTGSGFTRNEDLPTSLILDVIDQLVKLGGKSITLSGGDPLVRKDCLEIVSHAANRLKVRLLTNGTLVTPEIAKALADLDVHVQISLDGSSACTHDEIRGEGSFERTLRGLELLQSHGLTERLNISTTIMQQNNDEAGKMVQFAADRKVPMVRFLPLRNEGTARGNWIRIDAGTDGTGEFFKSVLDLEARTEQETRHVEVTSGLSGLMLHAPEVPEGGCSGCSSEMWCPTGRTMAIDYQGNVYLCIPFMHEKFYLGNVKDKSLYELHDSIRLRELYFNISSRRQKVEKCRTCQVKNLCQGGCAGMVFREKGTIWDTDGFCEIRKEFVKNTIFDMAEKKLKGNSLTQSACGNGI